MTYDVIIVLAGGVKDDGTLPTNVKKRVRAAKVLFNQGLAPRMLMSGRWSVFREKFAPIHTEATVMKSYAISIGIPVEAILKEEQSNDTESNAFHSIELFVKPNHWHKLIVVTSDFHLPRVKYIFDTLLGSKYQIRYEAAETNFNALKWWIVYAIEKILLFLTRRQARTSAHSNDLGGDHLSS